MKSFMVMLLVTCSCGTVMAQHQNSTFATLAVNEIAADVLGEGPVEADVFTQSELTMRLRGVPLQPFMVLLGDYEVGALSLGSLFQIDLALTTIDVLADGITTPSPDLALDAGGNYAQSLAFPGRANQSDFAIEMQCLVGNPYSIFGLSTTAAGRIQVHAGYQEHTLAADDFVEVPFREGMTFEFYGHSYDRVWVTSNGRVTFAAPNDVSAFSAGAFNQGPPAIAGMYHDFDPSAVDNTKISTSQFKIGEDWHFRISFESVQEFYNPGVFFDFDVTLMPYGTVQIAIGGHLVPPSGFSVVGVTPGGFIPTGFLGASQGVTPLDLSATVGNFVFAGDGLPAYEHFFDQPVPFFPLPPFDLPNTTMTFYPAFPFNSGLTGYNVN